MLATEQLHTISLPKYSKPTPSVTIKPIPSSSPKEIAQAWLDRFSAVLASGDASKLGSIIHDDSWWRDALAVTWDLRTVRGLDNIVKYVSSSVVDAGWSNLKLVESGKFAACEQTPIEGLDWVESMFEWETRVGRGKGMLRLVATSSGQWKAYMLYTALVELKGFEERIGERRAHGGLEMMEGGAAKGNWYERRQRQIDFLDEEPNTFIVGAGEWSTRNMDHQ